MDHYNELHGIIFTLLVISHPGLWSCQGAVEPFTPINVELHPDPDLQCLVVKWSIRERAYSSSLHITFHLQVARSRNRIIILEEYYNTSLSGHGKPFSWVWDSELPLECDSHSVRIRSGFPSEEHWNTWSKWYTHYGKNVDGRKYIMIYPHEKIVPEGSDISFCCLPRHDDKVKEMPYKNKVYPNQSQLMNTESFVITVKNVSMTLSDGDNVICSVNPREHNGTVLIVSRPPGEPKDFSCKTHDLQALVCTWRPGPRYNFYGDLRENYTLQEWVSGKWSPCFRDNCTWHIVGNQQEYNFTLTVRNLMGEQSIHAAVTLNETVQLVVPSKLLARDVNATYAVLFWSLPMDYTSVVLHCQTDLQKSTANATFNGKTRTELYSMSLTHLHPFTKYELRVRCMAEASLVGWSDWSSILIIRTHEDVPSAPVDVWREVQDNRNSRLVTLHWKPLPDFTANGNISHYNLKWWSIGNHAVANKTRVHANHTQYKISIGRQAHVINITAQNGAGVSPAAKIKVPGTSEGGYEEVITERASSNNGAINVSWKPGPSFDGYVVEWCNFPRSPHCNLQWKKYNSDTHTDVIKSGVFQQGVRYDFRIYGSKEDGEHLLGKRTGYIKELVSSRKPKVKITKIDAVSLSLDWSPYPLDESQEGFVAGYTIYMKDTEGNCKLEASNHQTSLERLEMCKFFIGDPNTMSTTISGLKANTDYEVAVVAVTGGGETSKEFIKASTLPDGGAVIMSILLPVIIVSVLVVLLLIAGCWKRAWLKENCCPDIPDPNKSKVLTLISSKGPASRWVTPTDLIQKVEPVHILENKKDICHELKNNNDRQSDVIYTPIQRPNSSNCSESSADMYITSSPEHGSPCTQTPEKLNTLPSPTCMEFFNQNYNSTPDDTSEDFLILGYRPQEDTTKADTIPVHESLDGDPEVPIHLQYTDLATGSEPMSPTSVTSTSFILTV